MQVIFDAAIPTSVGRETVPGLRIRQRLQAPDGTVHRIPIDPRRPDAHTIIGALQFVIDQFGRDPRVRAVTVSILRSRVNNDLEAHARTINNWVVNRMVYLPDPDGGEFIQTPAVLLNTIERDGRAYGDCDDHVVLLAAMLNSIGIRAKAAGVKLFGSDVYNHVVVEYQLNGRTMVLDPCAKVGGTPFYGERLTVA